jgi:sorbitol-6-phosphate 2-dehydrogenase
MLITIMNSSWLNLENKNVIVTGGAKGLGYAIVRELLEDGANVAVCDLYPESPELADKVFYVQADVSNRNSVEAMVQAVLKRYGTIDAVVNNAGISIPRLLVDENNLYEMDETAWDKVMNVNLKGVFFVSQAVAKQMVRQGYGVILNMSSESGLEGSEGQSAYAASKNAVNSLTRSWAKELGRKGIRVVGVAPGVLESTNLRTPDYEAALAYARNITVEELRLSYEKTSTIPLGRIGKLAEVANVVAFLISDHASYIHGVTINVAGGKTRG